MEQKGTELLATNLRRPMHGTSPSLRKRAALGVFLAIFLVVLLKLFLPDGTDYTKGFAPVWVPAAAAVLGVVAVLAMGWKRMWLIPNGLVPILAWGVCVLLIWSSAGFVFDMLRAAAVLGIPGMPPVVDWSGFAVRIASLLGAVLMVAVTVPFQRMASGACAVCGRGSKYKARSGSWLGYAAFVLSFPYPLLKLYWSLGGTLWDGQSYGHHSAYGEITVFSASALLALSLVQRWGRIFPSWIPLLAGKAVPHRILMTGGWTAAGMTTTLGLLAIFGSILQALGASDGPVGFGGNALVVSMVYGSWFLLGLTIGGATWRYQQLTRPACRQCGR